MEYSSLAIVFTLLSSGFVACAPVDGVSPGHPLDVVRPRQDFPAQALAVAALVRRLLGDQSGLFTVHVDPSIGPPHRDTFHLVKVDGDPRVNITGTSGVAVAWGLHYYLTQLCGCHVSWDYDQLSLPSPLPSADLTVTSVDRFRYYQNVCTSSYTFVWWDWARWERELDWMALNGINLALAFAGQEAVWDAVYRRLGLSQQDVDAHFSGPAFLAWLRMGNMRGWAGPLSRQWHSQSVLLQRRILDRMRALGIVPVLPAFAGHVPRAFNRLFPNASTTPLPTWNHFEDEYCCPLLLDPTDPLFQRVGRMFMMEMISMFGTDHIYNCDTFNEMQPAESNPEYMDRVGKAIFAALTGVDPSAIWMIQNWIFVHEPIFWTESRAKALLTSVPVGRMLILDLMAELQPQYLRFESYYGQPFIWCMLHNFGGTLGLYGAITNVNRNVFEARAMPNSTMVGTGLTMEGTGQNYIMYDFMNEMSWRSKPANLTQWITNYTTRRYGRHHILVDEAWQILKDSVYTFNFTWKNHGRYILVRHPTLRLQPRDGVYSNTSPLYHNHGAYVVSLHPTLDLVEPLWYRVEEVRDAWKRLLDAAQAAPALRDSDNFRFDLVDVSRQGLQLAAAALYKQVVRAFRKKQVRALRERSAKMLDVLSGLDALLATDRRFMLGPWLQMARARATSELEEQMYEWNARNQLTLWGPRGEIRDYAAKQWAGMVSDYYRPRWQYFLAELQRSLEGGATFNQTAVSRGIFADVEEPFTMDRTDLPTEPRGDAFAIASRQYDLWHTLLTTDAVTRKRTTAPASAEALPEVTTAPHVVVS